MFDALKRWLDPEQIERERAIEWRTPESERSTNSYTVAHKGVLYGVDSPQDRALCREIDRRRAAGQSLAGLSWPASSDPYHPANNPEHPYHIS